MLIKSFLGGSYVAKCPVLDAERTVNLLLERTPPHAVSARGPVTGYSRPGARNWHDANVAGGERASFEHAGRYFAVIGTNFGEFSSAGVFTTHGQVTLDIHPATICSNGDAGGQLAITSGTNYYVFTLATNTFAAVSGMAGKATMACHIDGFILILDASVSAIYQSDLLDAATVDPANVAFRALAGDPFRALAASESQRVVYVNGTLTSERWRNVGSAPFAFAPIPDALIPYGTAAPFSLKDLGGAMVWVTKNKDGQGDVLITSGTEPRFLSDHALHVAMQRYADAAVNALDDFIADTLQWRGHRLYLMTSVRNDCTWVYDLTAAMGWTEWLTWDTETNAYHAWPLQGHVHVFGKHLMGNRASSMISELRDDVATDVGGGTLRLLRIFALPWAEGDRVFVPRIELLYEAGLAPLSGQGADSHAMIRMSFNGGKTFGAERRMPLGARGDYDAVASLNRCGSGTKPVVELVVTDPCPLRLFGFRAELHDGRGGAQRAEVAA